MNTEKQDHVEKEKTFFFYIDTKVDVDNAIMTGAEIKAAIKAVVPAFDLTHDLILEGHGAEEDQLITDSVSLDLGHGHGPKHFYSKPPTNFGQVTNAVTNTTPPV